jgi:ureidoacrylate peracid hydrolase
VHKIRLNPNVVERVMRRRGSLHAFNHLEANKTALLAIDMQNWMIDPALPTAVRYGIEIVEPANAVADVLRDAGGTIVWVKMIGNEQIQKEWGVFYDSVIANQRDLFVSLLREEGEGGEIYPGMHVHPNDLISRKTRYSCVLAESSDLHKRLVERGIDTVIIAGAVTNVCCESSARDAMMMNYKTVVLADACAAHTDEEHNASLSNLLNMFADVRTSEEVVGLLKRQ